MAKPKDKEFEFVPSDILDVPGMVRRLREAEEPVSRYLYDEFSRETQKLMDAYGGSESEDEKLRAALVSELSAIVSAGPLYDQGRFIGVTLSKQTKLELTNRPEGRALIRLNVRLLEDAYQTELLRVFGNEPKLPVERVQTGMRIEKRMVKVLKGLAEAQERSLGEVVEDIVLHAFAGVSTYDGPVWQERIAALRKVYGMDYDVHAVRRFTEPSAV